MSWNKQPSEVMDYDFDWSVWLQSVGESAIQSHTVSMSPAGLTLDSSVQITSDTAVKCWFSGGNSGTRYKITCRIVTPEGREKEHEYYLFVKDK